MMVNVFAMTLKMRNHAATVAANLQTQMNRLSTSAMTFTTRFGKSIKATRTSLAGLAAQFLTLKQIIAVTFAYRGIQRFVKWVESMISIYNQQTQATLELSQALASTNQFSKENVGILEKQASAMQGLIAVADHEITSYQALLANYGMEADKIRELMPLIADFAVAKQIKLRTAVDLAGKAFVGYFGLLSRYGVILDQSLSREEKYSEFMKLMNSYRGTAIKVASSHVKEVEKLKLAYGDLKEPMGEIISAGRTNSGMIQDSTRRFSDLRAFLEEWKPLLSELATEGFGSINDAISNLIENLQNDEFVRWAVTFVNVFRGVGAAIKSISSYIITGLKYAYDIAGFFLVKINIVKEALLGSEQSYREAIKRSNRYDDEFWAKIDERDRELERVQRESKESQEKASADLSMVWSEGGVEKYKQKLREQNELAKAMYSGEKEHLLNNTQNREAYNRALEKSLKLTQSMSQQFALASRLEQEQVKYLVQRISNMREGDVGQLTEMEKELISKQGVLKEAFNSLFGRYASKMLGLERAMEDEPVKINIDLTEDARRLISIDPEDIENANNRRYELSMAG